MDRIAIEELFGFTDFSWRTHAEAVSELGDDALVKPVPGSGWPALRDAFGHINWAYERWLADPAGTTDAPFDVEAIRSWDDLGVVQTTGAWAVPGVPRFAQRQRADDAARNEHRRRDPHVRPCRYHRACPAARA